MKVILAIASMWIAVGAVCCAEPRWCTVTGLGPGQNLKYEPIARAAQVSGVVVSRVVYLPDGHVQAVEPVFGPKMLSAMLEDQLKRWTIKTNADGSEPCVSLVVATFKLSNECKIDPAPPTLKAIDISQPSTLKLETAAEPACPEPSDATVRSE